MADTESAAPNSIPDSMEQMVERLRRQMAAQMDQMAQLRERIEQQQAEIVTLRKQAHITTSHVARSPRAGVSRASRGGVSGVNRAQTGRRTLLKWMGLATAGTAAATAVMATAPATRAAGLAAQTNGDAILAGETTTATATTTLSGTSGSGAQPLLSVDNSSASNASGLWGLGAPGFSGVYGVGAGSGSRGLYGVSDSGYGVMGASSTGIDLIAFGTGRVQLVLQGSAGAPTTGSYGAGEMIRDLNGDLWLCTADGSPGTWVRVAHVPDGYSGGGIAYLSKPIRLLDTRNNNDTNAMHNNTGPISSSSPYTLVVAGDNWQSVQVPSNAVGAIGKVTVVSGAGGSGYVALVPSGSGTPTTGTLPYGANATLATSFNVGLGGSPGAIDIYVGGTSVDVVVDLFGVVA